MWLLSWPLGCEPSPTSPPGDRAGHTAVAPTGDTGRDTSSGAGSHTGEPWPEVRCSDRAPEPLVATTHPTARAHHDVLFDPSGHLFGGALGGLWRFPAEGEGRPIAAGTGDLHQLEWLPDGAIAALVDDTGALERVDPETGGRTPLGPGGYAARWGPGGGWWSADGTALYRSQGGPGPRELALGPQAGGRPKVVAFDRTGATAYVGTVGGTGMIYALPLDGDGAPAGPAVPFASAGGGWHDAIGVDACGQVWVTDAVTTALYRVDPDGVASVALDLEVEAHGHGMRWGSGIGGWRSDALYLAQPYAGDRVAEVVVGVPSADWRGGRYVVVP